MMLSYGASIDILIEAVNNIRQKLGISWGDYPIDIYNVIEQYEYLTVAEESFEAKGLGGFLIRNKLPEASVIVVNSNQRTVDKNFAVCHEIIHYFCHDFDLENKLFACSHKKYIRTPREQQANEGAAELLAPAQLIIPDLHTAMEYYRDKALAIKETAKAYGVATRVMERRITNLGIDLNIQMKSNQI